METPRHYLSLRVGHNWYGIDVDQVIEVLHFVWLTELPGAPPHVLGLLTLRDTLMPVVDLRLLFNLMASDLQLDTPIIALRTPQGPLAIVVDEVDDVGQPVTEGGESETNSTYVKRVVKLQNRLLLLLDAMAVYTTL